MLTLVDVTYQPIDNFAKPKPNSDCGTCKPTGDGCNPSDKRNKE